MSDGQFMFSNPLIIKGVSSAIIATAIDKYYFEQNNTTHNLVFGASTAFGIVIGSAIGSQIPSSVIEDTAFYNGKTIAQRSFELIFGAGVSYGAFAYSKYNYSPSDMQLRVAAVLATDFCSEYITDYMTGNPLAYFN